MSEYDELSEGGRPARVRAVDNEGYRLYLEFSNGIVGSVTSTQLLPYDVGDVVLIRPEDNHIEAAPDAVWPDERVVGIVRLRLPDVTLIDANARLIQIPTSGDVDYRVGNTVEASTSKGVLRVLSDEPLGFLNSLEVDDALIEQFVVKKNDDEGFENFGGLRDVVARARELIEAPLRHHEALSRMRARPIKGVIFTGQPGTGKTMLARIIANVTDAQFYEISGPEIFSKWYGQTESVLRRLFDHAKRQPRAIIFFDEIDSVAGQRAETAHEASRRVVAQLLTLMDGFEKKDNIVVIAATNRPQDIDIALRRPGRFDWEIEFRLPNREDREEILEVSAKRLRTRGTLPHDYIAEQTESWSAAELAAIYSEAALLAVSDKRDAMMAEDYYGGFQRVASQRRVIPRKPSNSEDA